MSMTTKVPIVWSVPSGAWEIQSNQVVFLTSSSTEQLLDLLFHMENSPWGYWFGFKEFKEASECIMKVHWQCKPCACVASSLMPLGASQTQSHTSHFCFVTQCFSAWWFYGFLCPLSPVHWWAKLYGFPLGQHSVSDRKGKKTVSHEGSSYLSKIAWLCSKSQGICVLIIL